MPCMSVDASNRTLSDGLAGVTCVLVAPMHAESGAIVASVAEEIASRVDRAGIHAVTVLGNTAEVFQLSATERRLLLAAAAPACERSLLIAGIAGPQAESVQLAEEAAALGYQAAMLHEPPDPLAGERGLIGLIHGFADRSPLPTVLYARTPRMSRTVLAEAAAHPRVIGVKYARHELSVLGSLLADRPTREACTWVCGLAESMIQPMRGLGLVGFTSGLANVRPDLALSVWQASRDGDLAVLADRVRPILPFETMRTRNGGRHNVAVLKSALRIAGVEAGAVRPPCDALGPDELEGLRAVLGAFPAARETATAGAAR